MIKKTVRKPEFITFTGIDERTPDDALYEISQRWPVEFGLLISQKQQGQHPRYPDPDTLSRILWRAEHFNLAAHVCGSMARDIMTHGACNWSPIDFGYCKRVQINCEDYDLANAERFGLGWGVQTIVQTRADAFPYPSSSQFLFDRSGGNGVAPSRWPSHPVGRYAKHLVGYAGGVNPDTVVDVIEAIDACGPYWIDMESGVRTDDWFDLNKVVAVCRAVYGDSQRPQELDDD